MLVLVLGMAVYLMMEARKPGNWDWILAFNPQGVPQEGGEVGQGPPIDTRLNPAGQQEQEEVPGTFRVPPPDAAPADADTSGDYFPGVEPSYLTSIEDDTHFQPEETKAWFNLLGVLQKTDSEALRRASTGRVSFAQLFKQSDVYRGELVTTSGTVRRAVRKQAPANEKGIEAYYQLIFQPFDQPGEPMVIYALELPEGFPTGAEIEADGEVTGFYFKRWAYASEAGLRTAPTLLARTIDWQRPSDPVEQRPADMSSFLTLVVVAIAFAIVVTLFVYQRTRRGKAKPDEGDVDFSGLDEADRGPQSE